MYWVFFYRKNSRSVFSFLGIELQYTYISIFLLSTKVTPTAFVHALTGMNFKLCFSATGAYQQESLNR
jgi:hypothetical protein